MSDRPCMHTFAYDSYNALDKCRCGHYCSDHDRPPVPFDYESAYKRSAAEAYATKAERDSLATQLEQMRRERDNARAELAMADCALLSARATNAKLHRRAQGVDARSPDDADLIRRLRADVRGQAKHAGHVIGYVFRLRCALSDSQHARDADARSFNATIDREHARLERVERDLADLRAKLTHIREVAECDYHDTPRTVLRIIDEKEGGQ